MTFQYFMRDKMILEFEIMRHYDIIPDSELGDSDKKKAAKLRHTSELQKISKRKSGKFRK